MDRYGTPAHAVFSGRTVAICRWLDRSAPAQLDRSPRGPQLRRPAGQHRLSESPWHYCCAAAPIHWKDGTVLASGHDFYSSPRLSPDGRWLAFLAWDHPNMPWMGTGLYVLQLNQPDTEPLLIAGGERESVFQPEWAPDGSALYFVSDRSGWWNLYRQKSRTPTEPLAVMEAEFGKPQWVFGMSTYAFAGGDRLVCSAGVERASGTSGSDRFDFG